MENDFIIVQVSWQTQRIRNWDTTEDDAKTYRYFKTLIDFLQKNNLVVRPILNSTETVTDSTCIRKSDLTEDGFQIFKQRHFDKWITGIMDKGKSPEDIQPLQKALLKIRT